MTTLKRLIVCLALVSVLAVTAFAGEIPSPPAPCEPGETSSPPCSAQSVTGGETAPGEIPSPPVSIVDVLYIAGVALRSAFLA
jgi:hypothetical protein